jgi:transposase InsO family protein
MLEKQGCRSWSLRHHRSWTAGVATQPPSMPPGNICPTSSPTSSSISRFNLAFIIMISSALRTDNGPEFLGEAFTEWAKGQGMAIQYIQPGKPNQNAHIERFNRTFREEVLDQYLFRRLEDIREAAWW